MVQFKYNFVVFLENELFGANAHLFLDDTLKVCLHPSIVNNLIFLVFLHRRREGEDFVVASKEKFLGGRGVSGGVNFDGKVLPKYVIIQLI